MTKKKKIIVPIIVLLCLSLLVGSIILSQKGISMYNLFEEGKKTESTYLDEQEFEEQISEVKGEELEEVEIEEPEEEEENEPEPEPKPEESEPVATPPPDPAPTTPPPAANWWDYPANIVSIPIAHVTHISVVDKGHKLSENYAPTDLVTLSSMPGIRVTKALQVRGIIIEPLRQLGAAALADGVDLSVISAYRSFQTQQSTYNYWVSYNGGNTSVADQISARPGHSEHQLGTVVDFSSNEIGDAIGAQFNNTEAAKWLLANAPTYGFRLSYPAGQEANTGYAHESWHWRWWGN